MDCSGGSESTTFVEQYNQELKESEEFSSYLKLQFFKLFSRIFVPSFPTRKGKSSEEHPPMFVYRHS